MQTEIYYVKYIAVNEQEGLSKDLSISKQFMEGEKVMCFQNISIVSSISLVLPKSLFTVMYHLLL